MVALILAVMIVGSWMAFGVGGVLVGHRLMRERVAASHNEVMIALFSGAKVVYAVLLGFLVVVVWEGYDTAHRNVAEEAAMLVPLYRLTNGMEARHGAEARTLIRGYANAVIHDDWPILGSDRFGSSNARRFLSEMDRQFARLDPATRIADAEVEAEFLRTKSQIVADRNERLLEATDSIPWVMWLGAVGGGVLTMVMSFLIYMERVWLHALISSLDGALTGLLLFVMVMLSHPYSGPLALGPEHFASALQVMDDVDKGI